MLRILGEPGDIIRVRLRKKKMLKLKTRKVLGKAYSEEEKTRMLAEARKARSPHIYLALTLALNAGMRDAEIKSLSWAQIHFDKKFLAVGRAKTEGGEGRTIPLNSELSASLAEYVKWYEEKFGKIRPEWYVFPFWKSYLKDPTRHVTTLKTAWSNVRENADVTGRWHDNRHTLITELVESGAGDQTIMDIAGHVSKQMLKHYSHIRMEAKRTALESIVKKPAAAKASKQQAERSAQKSPRRLQKGRRKQIRNQGKTIQTGSSSATKKPRNRYAESPVITQHFEGESKSPYILPILGLIRSLEWL